MSRAPSGRVSFLQSNDSRDVPLHWLGLAELAAAIERRAISPLALTAAMLDRIAVLEPALSSYATVTADQAMAQAKAAEAEIAAGGYRGPLHGVPISVKDLLWTKGLPTAGGTIVHRDFRPDEDATVVARLKQAGAVILGKTQMTEGAFSDHHPDIVAPRNPWNAGYWPGISSSGSGVAAAAGLCFGTLGSDTGGSIRWPSAANGVTGLKPTWGRVSRHGAMELAASLDHIGPMARSAIDAAIILQVIAGPDPKDPTALVEPVPDYCASCEGDLAGLRIAVDTEWIDDVEPQTRAALDAALDAFRALGAEPVTLRFPDVSLLLSESVLNMTVEAAFAHRATYPSRKDEYGPVFAGALEMGHALSAFGYQKILLNRAEFRGRVDTALAGVDLLLTPVQPMAPLSLEEVGVMGERPELIAKLARYTYPFDATGHPTLTFPGGFSNIGLPIGLQLVAQKRLEATLLKAGAAFQRATDWHRCHPDL